MSEQIITGITNLNLKTITRKITKVLYGVEHEILVE